MNRSAKSPAAPRPSRPVFVCAHVSEVYGPVQALRQYLQESGFDFRFLTHPFPYTGLEGSLREDFRGGRLVGAQKLRRRSPGQGRQFLANLASSLWQGLGRRTGWTIGIGNLNALAGLALRALGRTERVCYYVIDHTPRRFANPVLDFLYRWVDGICCRHCDLLWCLSDRIRQAKQERGAPANRCVLVPVGARLQDVARVPASRRRPQVLVAMSHLTREKGIQLVLESFSRILKKAPRARLEIVGTGPYEGELRRQARDLGLGGSVAFLGLMDHARLFRYLPTCGVGLATYTEDSDNIAYFADPTKPKEYLACGLPVVVTRVPWIWEAVADPKAPMGVAIGYRREDLVEACLKLLKRPAFHRRCRSNALRFAQELDWTSIFNRAFDEMRARE